MRSGMEFGYMRVVEVFDKDPVAGSFLREDGEGGFASGVYRMAREIERLRSTILDIGKTMETSPTLATAMLSGLVKEVTAHAAEAEGPK